MRYLLCSLAIALALPLMAATETASVTVPNDKAAQLATIVESWIQGQVNPDGTPKYPGATKADRRQALLNAILRDGVRRVVKQGCIQTPADCTADIKAARDAEAKGKSDAKVALEDLIQ